jgi:hypothetical protein
MGCKVAFFSHVANHDHFDMVQFFPLFLNFGPNGFHFLERVSILPIKHQNDPIDSFQQDVVEDI